jgi:multidrug resistance protein MdtO
MRRRIADHLDEVARSVVDKTTVRVAPADLLVDAALLESPRYGEYARNSIARYEELEANVACLSTLA